MAAALSAALSQKDVVRLAALLARAAKPLIKVAVEGCDWAEAKRLREGKDRAESVKCALLQYATRFTENKMKVANPVENGRDPD